MRTRELRRLIATGCALVALPLLALGAPAAAAPGAPAAAAPGADTYRNPLVPRIPGDGAVESCADPTVLRGRQPGETWWYLYCTTDPLNDADTAGDDDVVFHPVPTMRSRDLVNWTYVGDALPTRPAWADASAGLWAPDVVYSRVHKRYYMTFVVTDVVDAVSGEPGCHSDSAIGVATSRRPTGPWKISSTPVVAPRRAGGGCNFYWTYDPDVLGDTIDDQSVLYYGSYYGGVFGQRIEVTPTGMSTTGPATQVTIANRYEGANVVEHGGYYYLFASATNCCNGPLTGYSVFAGRSTSPLGPFVDREGNSLLSGRVGGTPVVSMNGNRWVGTGHNSVFRDFDGQWWTVYHAVDRDDPYFASEPGFTKRPALLDPLDWVDGWPTVRAGRWASDQSMPAPAAQPGEQTAYRPRPIPGDVPGDRLPTYSDEFDGATLADRWSWVRRPADGTYGVEDGHFRFETQAADLYVDSNTASVLTEDAPDGDYVVEAKVHLDVPGEGCCFNYVQAGLVVHGSDDAFIKLTNTSIWETRQTEFAKEVPTASAGYPRYGNTVVGPPSDWTYLRIVKRDAGPDEQYTAYTSQDGTHWVRGGTWTHRIGDGARIGLVSMGGSGYTARFDYLRVSRLAP